MTKYISTQYFLSTAEHARGYFYGTEAHRQRSTQVVFAPGTYRVINGALTRIIYGIPSELAVNHAAWWSVNNGHDGPPEAA